jgi:phosphoglycolate phosphatase-like HAD superfamily hydrolase
LRKLGNDEVDLERFEEYVRGGVDILYEKLIEGATTPEEYVIKMYEFMSDFNNFFNREVSREDVLAATRE